MPKMTRQQGSELGGEERHAREDESVGSAGYFSCH